MNDRNNEIKNSTHPAYVIQKTGLTVETIEEYPCMYFP